MKKWFVVVCCLFLALSSAWGATLLSEGFDGMAKPDVPTGWSFNKTADYYSSAPYIGEAKPALKLSTATAELVTPVFSTGATKVSFVSGTATNGTGIGNTFAIAGRTGEEAEWEAVGTVECTEAGTQSYSVDIANSSIVQLKFAFARASSSATASLDDILVEGEEPAPEGITVTFDQTNWFEIVEGTLGASVTATADNGVPPYTYVWNCDQSEAITDVAGATLAIPATLTEGDYSLFVTVTDSDDGELGPQGGNFGIGLRVVKLYEVTVVNGVDAHGTIVVDLAHAKAGDTVTIGTEPDDGYVLESLSATWAEGELEITDGTFTMPAGEVTVTGTFAEYTGGDLTITFDENKTTDPGYAATSFSSATLPEGADAVAFDALRCYGGDAGFSGKAMRVQNVNGTNGFFATANAFEKPISRIRFACKAYNTNGIAKEWVLDTSTDGSAWTTVATVAPTSNETWDEADVTDTIPANSTYFRITGKEVNTTKTAFVANFDEIDIWFGEATYHVELSGVENGARVPYDDAVPAVTLSAEAKDGGTEPFTYEWTVNGEPVDGYTGATYEFSAIGEYEVSVVCTDAADVSTEPASVSFSIEQQYIVHSPSGLEGGVITAEPSPAFVGETVTVTATPAAGYALDGELTATWGEDNTPLELSKSNTFEMPAGDVHLGGSFRAVQDTATLPFEWHGPWKEKLAALDGVTGTLGTDKSDKNYEDQGNDIAVFSGKSHNFCVKFVGTPATVSYWIHASGLDAEDPFEFSVQESDDGETWSNVAVYTPETENITGYQQVTNELSGTSRYVKFSFTQRGSKGEVGVDGIVISGEGGDQPEANIVFIGETTATLGGTITLSFALENYEDACTWALEPAEGFGEIDSATGVYTWTPAEVGSAAITVNALDETLEVIATTGEILLTVEDAPGPGPDEPIPATIVSMSAIDYDAGAGTVGFTLTADKDLGDATATVYTTGDLTSPPVDWTAVGPATVAGDTIRVEGLPLGDGPVFLRIGDDGSDQ